MIPTDVSVPAAQKSSSGSGKKAVAAWIVLVAGVFLWGYLLRRSGHEDQDALPPLYATPRLLTWQMLPAAAFAALCVAGLPILARRLRWRWLLLTGWAASAAWAVVLAVSDGIAALATPLTSQNEYLAGLGAVRADPLEWVRTFTAKLHSYPVHTQGHPPLPMLFLWALDSVGLRGAGWAAAAIILIGSSAVAAIAITLAHLTSQETARRVLPFLVLAPIALWIATAMDAVFLGVGAWGIALFTIAAVRRRPAVAVAGGLLLGALPYLSYGLLPLFAVPVAVAILARPSRTILIALVCGLLVIPVAFTAAGFWWPAGVAATHQAYEVAGGSSRRSYLYFLVGDLGVLALLVGPAAAYALPAVFTEHRRHRTVAWLAGAALLGMLALDISSVTRGEVERIWVPYAAWVLTATAAHRTPARGWLAVQAATAIIIQALVMSAW